MRTGLLVGRAAAEAEGHLLCSGKGCRSVRLGRCTRCPCGGAKFVMGAAIYWQHVEAAGAGGGRRRCRRQRDVVTATRSNGEAMRMRLVRSGWLGNIATAAAGRPPATPSPALFNAPAAAVDGKHPTLLPTPLRHLLSVPHHQHSVTNFNLRMRSLPLSLPRTPIMQRFRVHQPHSTT